jgi:glycosyltransferase involved in cell wall biosynthesis
MMELSIAILGTRGIPNHYGGYEQAATFLSAGLVEKGNRVTVYNSHNHPYRDKTWKGVDIMHCYDPEYKTGTTGQFIYDLNCIRHARKKNYDVLLLMGYTSSSVWGRFYPKKTLIISNMDGLEWQRSKYSAPVRRYLRYAENLAVKYSDFYIADALGIQDYLREKYNITSRYIPYGAEVYKNESTDVLDNYEVTAYNYYLLVARIEPENNIETILDGFLASGSEKQFLLIGNINNKYSKKIQKKYSGSNKIRFIGALFDEQKLHSLKVFSGLYFHGHSVGGTNPSLLEAMASRAVIVAHDNPFNRAVLDADARYFSSSPVIRDIIMNFTRDEISEQMIRNNLEKIKKYYNWQTIINQYESFIRECYNEMHS